MADITMCADVSCAGYSLCHRAQAYTDWKNQSVFVESPRRSTKETSYTPFGCDKFIESHLEEPRRLYPPENIFSR